MGFSAAGMVEFYKTLGENIVGVEIGVCRGENIKQLLDNCPNIRKIYGIDPWTAYQDKLTISQETADEWHKAAVDLLAAQLNTERAILIHGKSLDAAEFFASHSLNFIFIDGNHSYDMVLADCRAWWPKICPGGLLSGHDFRKKDREVRQAVYEFSNEIIRPVVETKVITNVQGPCWYIKKPEET